MRKKLAHHLSQQVNEAYTAIAKDFSASRQTPWEEFGHFLSYVHPGDRVLDLGCGNGRLYASLKDKIKVKDKGVEYLGIDQNEALLQEARNQFPEAQFKLGDMAEVALPAVAHDVIFCIAAFHHLPGRHERKRVSELMRRTLKPGGILVLTVWNLFQWKYLGQFLTAIGSWLLHLGFKYAWNDLFIPWADRPLKRYYHAFTPREIRDYFPKVEWKLEEFYFSRKEKRVSFWRAFNICLILRKK